MRKLIIISVFGVLLCIILSSCGIPAPPKEKQIVRDLPRDITTVIIENPFDLAKKLFSIYSRASE